MIMEINIKDIFSSDTFIKSSKNKHLLQGGEVWQRVEGSRHDRGKLVVVEREQTYVLQA